MTTFSIFYTLGWSLACLAAIHLMLRHRSAIGLFRPQYWHFLLQGWKIVTFLIAAVGLTIIAPYTGDPTWDYVDASFMSILTFATAPWAVGTLYLAIRGKAMFAQAYVAICIWIFSASWSYDLYLVLRDGFYPVTWLPNMFASSVLYILAGLLWNLDWKEGRGVIFGFMEPSWPQVTDSPVFRKILWFAIPFMVLAAGMIVVFLTEAMPNHLM
ncbi:MAG: hypothetical protein GTO24_15210 [candidate division Zixibacteria bacterium]|nr:hypothetical protein [candidate division Zixibacteria bacterium]